MDHSSSTAGAQADSSKPAAISVRSLSKQFTTQIVLADVSFDIFENELLVILGPSGSGKTTILRIIAGLETPEAGEVYLKGRRVTALPPQARGLGVVFQEQALFQKMSVEENIAFGLKLRHVAKDRIVRTVAEMLELTRLGEHRKKIPAQLSGGQRQRVALARALAFEPDALLFDEPFSALDAVTRVELRREVRSMLQAMNVSALFITHDQEEALELGDRIAVLNAGRIEQIATPFEIYNRPKNEFVATFLGAANVLLGRWQEGRVFVGGIRLQRTNTTAAFAERQAVKIVFRPEDAVLSFQPQYLDTPFYLGAGVVEELSYTGPIERLIIRLSLKPHDRDGAPESKNSPDIRPAEEKYTDGFPITVTRSKWKAGEMGLSAGDQVVVGLKDYRLLAHYPLHSESAAKVLRNA
ncbi:MAG TPA: ABC transporter ATP-binding protein [Pyrinomonadaceae bacterium]